MKPTSSLDNESELAIKLALQNLMRDRITLVIAHRLSTIEQVDKIIVLDKGRIIETGTHQQLLEKQGRYAQLQQAQLMQKNYRRRMMMYLENILVAQWYQPKNGVGCCGRLPKYLNAIVKLRQYCYQHKILASYKAPCR